MNILEAMKQAFMITDSIYRGGVGGGGDDRGIMSDNGKDIYCIDSRLWYYTTPGLRKKYIIYQIYFMKSVKKWTKISYTVQVILSL